MLVRYGSYNLFEWDPESDRSGLIVDVIRALDLDVLAVQEVKAERSNVGPALEALAELVDMDCHDELGRPTIAAADGMLHPGLLRRRGLPAVDFRTSALGYHGHPLATMTVEFADGTRVRHGSHHGSAFCPGKRTDQAAHAVGVMTRPEGCPQAVLCGDCNATSAERRPDGEYYDADPYTHDLDTGEKRVWYDDLIFQVKWSDDAYGNRMWWADRSAGEMYLAGGLRDVAAVLDVPWAPTVGHWPTDPHGKRRIDWSLCTGGMLPALRDFLVAGQIPGLDVEFLQKASDHFPFVGSYETAAIDQTFSRLPGR
jgi:hypothetical protein